MLAIMLHVFTRIFQRPAPHGAEAPGAPPALPKLVARGTDTVSTFAPEPEERPAVDAAEVATLVARLRELLHEAGDGPALLPAVAVRLARYLQDREPDLNGLIRLVAQDPSLSARALRVANFALYAQGRTVDNLRQAVQRMGTRATAAVLFGEASRSIYELRARAVPGAHYEIATELFHDAVTVAQTAGMIAMALGRGSLDRAYLGGMLHDLGKAVALRALATLPKDELRRLARPTIEAALEELHIEVGLGLLEAWGLPETLRVICAHHHDDHVEAGPEWDDVHIVRVASGTVARLRGRLGEHGHAHLLHSANALDVTPLRLRAIETAAIEHSRGVVETHLLDPRVALRGNSAVRVAQALDPAARRSA